MKKIINFIIILTTPILLNSQGNCPSNATQINRCGQAFTLTNTNANYDDCNPDECSGACPQCVGPKNNSNFDSDCTTEAPSTGCGCDLGGSIENNVWFYFCPTESCDYDVEVNISNCNSTSGMQYAVYGWNYPGSISNYYDEEGGPGIYYNNTTTNRYSFSSGECVYIMLDGYGGTECDISLTVNPVTSGGNACSGCTILAENIWGFDVKYQNNKAVLNWGSEDIDNVSVEHSVDGINWTVLGGIYWNTSETSFMFEHDDLNKGYNYYRLTLDGVTSTRTRVIYHTDKLVNISRIIDISGREIYDIENYNGVLIYVYEDGTIEKVIK